MNTANNSSKKLLVFDFDGVISNSIHDSFVSALNAYAGMMPAHNLPLDGKIDPPDGIFKFEKNNPGLFLDFKHLLPFGNRAEDYYVILRMIDKGLAKSIPNQDDFDRFREQLPRADKDDYTRRFYMERNERQDQDPEAWSRLLPAFPGVVEAARILSGRMKLAIATSKDMRSVDLQLRQYGMSGLFGKGAILDKDFSNSKRDHLVHFHGFFKISFTDMHFIDDKALHLLDVLDLGVRCHLALWGFNTEREHAIARENGINLLRVEDLARLE
jgi:phosphoglycolate phosphatase-like HAD superfamily hydrolase